PAGRRPRSPAGISIAPGRLPWFSARQTNRFRRPLPALPQRTSDVHTCSRPRPLSPRPQPVAPWPPEAWIALQTVARPTRELPVAPSVLPLLHGNRDPL